MSKKMKISEAREVLLDMELEKTAMDMEYENCLWMSKDKVT